MEEQKERSLAVEIIQKLYRIIITLIVTNLITITLSVGYWAWYYYNLSDYDVTTNEVVGNDNTQGTIDINVGD